MNLGGNPFIVRLKEHYDKVLALAVLLMLVCSVVLLVVNVRTMQRDEVKFNGWLKGLSPAHPHADKVDPSPYESANEALRAPFLLSLPGSAGATNVPWMFVPETRFNCRECRLPIPMLSEICPFCKTAVKAVVEESLDNDSDGMPTVWERQFALDPFDAADAQKDLDDDGYTNLEEFTANTDPTDPKSRPAAVERLQLTGISGTQFALRFNSRIRTQSGGYKFGLNYKLPNGQIKTDFVELGELVAGFKVEKYEDKQREPATPPAIGVVDRSELTLLASKGDAITLVIGQPVQYVELTAHLSLTLRGSVETYKVRKGDTFELDGRKYTVIDIDAKGQLVIITEEQSRMNRTITLTTAAGGERQ